MLGFLDSTLLWGNLSVSLLVIVAAAVLVPALSLKQALVAILVGAVAGNLLLGLAGMIGADAGAERETALTARVPEVVQVRLVQDPPRQVGERGQHRPDRELPHVAAHEADRPKEREHDGDAAEQERPHPARVETEHAA